MNAIAGRSTTLDIPDLARTAADVQELNHRLARETFVTPEIARAVGELNLAVSRLPEDRWRLLAPPLSHVVFQASNEAAAAAARGERTELRIALERLGQALADASEHEATADDRNPTEIARWLVDVMDLPQSEVAELVGIPPRTFQRWLVSTPTDVRAADAVDRLRATARTIAELRHSLTPRGMLVWLERPRDELGGRTPKVVLNESPEELPTLVALARRMRATALS